VARLQKECASAARARGHDKRAEARRKERGVACHADITQRHDIAPLPPTFDALVTDDGAMR